MFVISGNVHAHNGNSTYFYDNSDNPDLVRQYLAQELLQRWPRNELPVEQPRLLDSSNWCARVTLVPPDRRIQISRGGLALSFDSTWNRV